MDRRAFLVTLLGGFAIAATGALAAAQDPRPEPLRIPEALLPGGTDDTVELEARRRHRWRHRRWRWRIRFRRHRWRRRWFRRHVRRRGPASLDSRAAPAVSTPPSASSPTRPRLRFE